MMIYTKTDNRRRVQAIAPTNEPTALQRMTPAQAQRVRAIAFDAALEILG